jgi:sugar phosphate permease
MFKNKLSEILTFRSKKTGKIFFGWYTILGSAISDGWQAAAWIYGFGIYFKPLMNDFGWSRAETSAASSFGRIEGALEGPIGGIASDRYGPRNVYLLGAFLSGLGFILMYFINSLIGFYAVWLIAALGFNLGWSLPLDVAIANWFVKKRGTVLSIARLGRVIGGTLIPPLMAILLISVGWRVSFLILGILNWVIGGLIGALLIKPKRPEFYGLLPDGEELEEGAPSDSDSLIERGREYSKKVGEVEFTIKKAVKTRAFWVVAIGTIFAGMVYSVIQTHLVNFLTDNNYDAVLAASLVGLMVFFSVPGRLLGGIVGDRLHKNNMRYLQVTSSLCNALGLFLLVLSNNMYIILLALLFFGLGVGINSSATPVLVGRFFGRKIYGTVNGTIALIGLPVSVLIPVYAGWVYDTTGSYLPAFSSIAILAVLGSIFYLFATPPKDEP